MRAVFLLIVMTALLAGCGQKGPLYKAEDRPESAQPLGGVEGGGLEGAQGRKPLGDQAAEEGVEAAGLQKIVGEDVVGAERQGRRAGGQGGEGPGDLG